MYAVVFHAHQKIDRVAHRHLLRITDKNVPFASTREILHFEGRRGPDGSKFKNNPDAGELPWHFVDPFDKNDTMLTKTLQYHYDALVSGLKEKNRTRVAFEGAWLAHALVDGLTPAHHYPYEEELKTLRGGKDRKSRTSVVRRITVKGDTHRESMKLSFKLVGPKGLLMTHTAFEAGAFMIMLPLSLNNALPKKEDLQAICSLGVASYFQMQAKEVAALKLYDRFYKLGWTPKLARLVRKEMAPRMVSMVTLAWYSALVDADIIKSPLEQHKHKNA